ncbi:MAG TPA: Na/Pi cotransporter family protein [Oxalobacteraceae bacterium]|nr:Na/Pi cotransporter family protein [Oxalobacteraceae bacterium]
MKEILFPLIGGIGLFLVGMMLLSSGLVGFAGGALRKALVRFTGTPYKSFLSGALVTALAQSSTATTVTLIGFVSAGLISFSQAIGVVIGASLGNTATGWIVAGLGLKINLGFYTLPLVGIGAFMKLLTRGRWAELGMALAGFGLLFLGLNMLQDAMRALSDEFSLARLPAEGFGARVAIMLAGVVLTAVLQSSTAAIATTLTALHAQAINFDQAAAMVVGASIGTTLTGALVTIGGTLYAKRTALAHILFNLAAGLIAIVMLPVLTWIIGLLEQHAGLTPGALSLAAFHSIFIGAGVLLFLPLTSHLARIVERLLPERGEDLARHLDASLLGIPAVALEASQRTLNDVLHKLLYVFDGILAAPDHNAMQQDLAQAKHALDRSFEFVARIQLQASDRALSAQRVSQLHAVDHMLRLHLRLSNFAQTQVDFANPVYRTAMEQIAEILRLARAGLAGSQPEDWLERLEGDALLLASLSRQMRHDVLQGSADGDNASQVLQTTDAFRWMERIGSHIWRSCHYLVQGRLGNGGRQAAQPDGAGADKARPLLPGIAAANGSDFSPP